MAFNIKAVIQKIKSLCIQTPLPQILCYLVAKIFTALMQLPHGKKQSTYITLLICNLLFLLVAIGLKIIRHKFNIIRSLIKIQSECFLLWIIGIIMMIFSWGLLDVLEWGVLEVILTLMCEAMSIFMLTLMTQEQFITKMEFLAYEAILGIQIIAISLKTIGFIRHNVDSPNKDIVLLNLTTQIALMIILMDFLQKSYRRMKAIQIKSDMSRLENEMFLASTIKAENRSTIRESFETNRSTIRENFEIKQ